MLRGNRYTSATLKKTILQFPVDKILLALNDNRDVIESLGFDENLQLLLVEALVKIAADKSFQKNNAYDLLNVFDCKLKFANFSQLHRMITIMIDHKLEQETANFLLLELVERCSQAIADTTDVHALLMRLPRGIHDNFIKMLIVKCWKVPDNEKYIPDHIRKNINRFDEDSTLDVLRELSGLSFGSMLILSAYAATAFARHENIISLLVITVIGLCTRMDACQRERILNNSDVYMRNQLQGRDGEAMMQQRLIQEYDRSLSLFMKNMGRLFAKNMTVNDLLKVMTDIDQSNDPLFTPEAKRIALKQVVNHACTAVTSVDEMNLVLDRLHENDRYDYMKTQEAFWEKDLISRRKAFLSGKNYPDATSHRFFSDRGCNEFLKRKILFEAGYLARAPKRP